RLWEAYRLQPHRIRTFKRSNDPEFAEKVEDIVGLHMDPPKHAVVVSIDEKSQIQVTRRQIRRGTFHSVHDLQNAVRQYIDARNSDCRPFVWDSHSRTLWS